MRVLVTTAWTLVVLMAAGPALAGEVPPNIGIDTTWTAAESPFVISQDTVVADGIRLTIEPGVTVELAEEVSLIVTGELVARGSEAEPILFTGRDDGSGPARWNSVMFMPTAVSAEFDGLATYREGSIVEHCVFELGTRALDIAGASPYIHASTFRDNLVWDATSMWGGAAIHIRDGARSRIVDCTFDNNKTEGFLAQGGAVLVTKAEPIIGPGNVFTGNTSIYGGALTTTLTAAPIVGNYFEGNEGIFEGGAVSLLSTSSAFLNNTVTGNTSFADGGGVHVCVECYPHANPFIMDNTIYGNVTNDHGGAGVGAAYLRVFAYNNLYDNLLQGEPADFAWFSNLFDHYPEWVTNTSAANNWWGTTDAAAIAETVHDGVDDPAVGLVTWEPFLTAPVEQATPRVTITSLKIRYAEPADPMTVFLTVYNPGPARDLELQVSLGYDGGAPLPYAGELDFPGAVRQGDTYLLSLPADGVYYTRLVEPEYEGTTDFEGGAWYAAIYDAATGERVGDVCQSRFEFGGEPGGGF